MKRKEKTLKKEKRRALRPWKGLTLWCALFALGFSVAAPAAHIIDNDLMIFVPGTNWELENADPSAIYYPTEFADEAQALAYGEQIARQVSEEGMVLLTNRDDALPLPAGSRVSLFSTSSVNPVLGGKGAGRVDSDASDTLKEALEKESMAVNGLLWDFYDQMPDSKKRKESSYTQSTSQLFEEPWENYPQQVLDSFRDYGDAAVVILSRGGGEHMDIDYQQFNYLQLDETERQMMEQLCRLRDEGVFQRLVVVINAANTLEMTFLQEFSVDACLLSGTLGQYGANSLAAILAGKASPSGRLTDTWCYSNFSAPAMWNFTPLTYENAKQMGVPDNADTYQVYQEGIYIGYRYFETRYEDFVTGSGNAGDYRYADTVAFPFGYGLSYTQFLWEDLQTRFDPLSDAFQISLTVTNTGNVPGREVVQIYGSSPYTDYDRQNGVEKAAVILCGFAKTDLLAPGQQERVTICVPRRELTSFDAYGCGTYILEAGTYFLTAAANAHEAVNNTLAARGYTPENTRGAMTAPGNTDMVYRWEQEHTDTQTYTLSASGASITTRLSQSDPNLYEGSASRVTWLSRSDWTGTFPTAGAKVALTQMLAEDLQHNHYDPSQIDMSLYTIPVTDADNGLTLYDMMGKAYDDPDWQLLLDQLSFDETVAFIRDAFHGRSALESIQSPGTRDENGPTGLNTTFIAGDQTATAFASPVVMAATFNRELLGQVGRVIGNDCLRYGISALYGPGANLHRTAYGGRNFEYFSEDPFLSGQMVAAYVASVEKLGVNTLLKHFALNECETDRQGLGVWVQEQAARELYLKAFQKAFEEGNANGVMAAYTRWGPIWSGGNEALLQGVLREEWGCSGWIITDNAVTTLITVADGLRGGITVFDASLTVALNFRQYRDDPYMRTLMRQACHRGLYALVNSSAMNTVGPDTRVSLKLYWMVKLMIVLAVVFWCAVAVCAVMWRRRYTAWKKRQIITRSVPEKNS